MRPIPQTLRTLLEKEPRMKRCAASCFSLCEGRIEWDHVWIYAGRQINEPWAIVGVCKKHHYEKNGNREIKALVEEESLLHASVEDLEKYPRKDWTQELKKLGIYKTWLLRK